MEAAAGSEAAAVPAEAAASGAPGVLGAGRLDEPAKAAAVPADVGAGGAPIVSAAELAADGVPGAPAPGDLDEPARLRAALLRLGRRLRAIDAGTGLTPAELAVLGAVVRCGPVRPSELAQLEGLNPTMVSRLLAHLVDEKVLCRDDDPADRRGALVAVTARGHQLHQQLRAARAHALFVQLQRLPPAQQEAISAAVPALEALSELLGGHRR